tara:strand:- start:226 stop:651 length:426 start_codon:yes stop_codon:yes gene_type:complete
MGTDFLGFHCIPISRANFEILANRYSADMNGVVDYAIENFLERTQDEWEDDFDAYFEDGKGYVWGSLVLPNGTKLRMRYKGRYFYAEVKEEKITFEGESYSPSQLACEITGTARNAWRDFWVKKPKEDEWTLAYSLRQSKK